MLTDAGTQQLAYITWPPAHAPQRSILSRSKRFFCVFAHKDSAPVAFLLDLAIVRACKVKDDGEPGGGAETAAALPCQEGRAAAAHRRRRWRRHGDHLLGAQGQGSQGEGHRAGHHARSSYRGRRQQGTGSGGGQGGQQARRCARAWLRRRGHRHLAVPGRRAGEALRRVRAGPTLLRGLDVAVDGPVPGVPGGVPGDGAPEAGRGAVHGGRVQLRRDGVVQDGGGAPGPGPVAGGVGLRGGHDRLPQRDEAGGDRRQVVGRAAAAGVRQGAQGAALRRYLPEALVPRPPSQGLPRGDVHQPQGESRAAGRFGGQQQRRHRANPASENTSAVGRERQHFQHRARQDHERAARREDDAAEHKQGRPPGAPGEALRLQPAPQGVPGVRHGY